MRRAGSCILLALALWCTLPTVEASGRAVAVVVDVSGEVTVHRQGESKALVAYVGMDLFVGDRLSSPGAELTAFYESGGTVKQKVAGDMVIGAKAPVAQKPGVLSRLGSSLSGLFGSRTDVRAEEAGAVEAGLVMARVSEEDLGPRDGARQPEAKDAEVAPQDALDEPFAAPPAPPKPGRVAGETRAPSGGTSQDSADLDEGGPPPAPPPMPSPAAPAAAAPAPVPPPPPVLREVDGRKESSGSLSEAMQDEAPRDGAAEGKLRARTLERENVISGPKSIILRGPPPRRPSRAILDRKSGGGGPVVPAKKKAAPAWLPGLSLESALARARLGALQGEVVSPAPDASVGGVLVARPDGGTVSAFDRLADGATLKLQVEGAGSRSWSWPLTIGDAKEFAPVMAGVTALVNETELGSLVAARLLEQRGYRLAAYLLQRAALKQLREQKRSPVVLKRLTHQVAQRALELGDFQTYETLKADK